jgi:hypothetical protein
MLESMLVIGAFVLFGVIGYLTLVITPQFMLEFGLWLLAAGLLIGLPAGFWYHVVLYRVLAQRLTLQPGWWRAPVELHPLLTATEFRRVKPWFVAGAVGFGLCVVGGVAAIAALSIARFYV